MEPLVATAAGGPDWVVVGDWVVDESWFLVRHYSSLSKHTGSAHYRKLESQPPDPSKLPTKTMDLCGAGHLVRTLYSSLEAAARRPVVHALGEWSEADSEFLKHLVHSGDDANMCRAGRTGYELTPPITWCKAGPPAGLSLINLHPQASTLRTVRLYQKRGEDNWTIGERVDFAPPRHELEIVTIPSGIAGHAKAGVVVDDLGRGAVSEELIRALVEAAGESRWFVRVKKPEVRWLELLRDKRLDLIVLGPEVSPTLNAFERWHRDGAVTKQFLDLFDLHESLRRATNVVILTEKRELVGRFGKGSESWTIVGQSNASTQAINQVGWADAVVMCLALELQNSVSPKPEDVKTLVENALHRADRSHGVSGIPDFTPGTPPPADVKEGRSWSVQEESWRQATTGLGIVKADGIRTLEVWRGSSQLEGYVALTHEKSKLLDQIGKSLRDFKEGHPERSLGLMIEADPGSGKTFLAKCLADAFGYTNIPVDIAQLVARDDLFDYFDRIGTHQAESDTPVLAHVDEVNAMIAGQTSYGAFLAPLESNIYSLRGLTHNLKPCVWIFTGTKLKDGHSDEKRSDLQSRLAATYRIDFASLKDQAAKQDGEKGEARVDASARLEQVYLGASLIKRAYPDVRSTELGVLSYFYSMNPSEAPFRSIRRAIAAMRDVQHGHVEISNLDAQAQATVLHESVRHFDEEAGERVLLAFKPNARQATS